MTDLLDFIPYADGGRQDAPEKVWRHTCRGCDFVVERPTYLASFQAMWAHVVEEDGGWKDYTDPNTGNTYGRHTGPHWPEAQSYDYPKGAAA